MSGSDHLLQMANDIEKFSVPNLAREAAVCCLHCREGVMSILRLAAVLGTLSCVGCTASMAYRADDVPDKPIVDSQRVTGRVLIYTTQTDDDHLITARATSLTGAELKLTTPVGTMVREIALKVFSKVASDGADTSHDFSNHGRYTIVLRPQIENFEYGFPHPRKLGMELTPQVRITMRVTLEDAGGMGMLEKDYDSGVVSGDSQMINGKLVEQTNKLAHRAMYDLMLRAAADVHMYQRTQAAAASVN
jgi:hypothetical protein